MPEYFVIDGEGHVSFSVSDQVPETFGTIAKAQKRARELAKSEPGLTVVVAVSVAWVTCEVGAPIITMKERKVKR